MQGFTIVNGELKKYTGTGGDIVLPTEVRIVGDMAFYKNERITSVTFHSGVKEIFSHAFEGCKNLKSVALNDGLERIEPWAFSECTSLTYIKIPASVNEITYEAFLGSTALEEIDVDENNAYYRSIDGNLYDKDATTLLECAAGKTQNWFVFPSSVTKMNEKAFFRCDNLEYICLPKIACLETFTLYDCRGLKTLEIPQGVEIIKKLEIDRCPCVKKIIFPDGVREISRFMLHDCDGVEQLSFPDGVMKIERLNLKNCFNLKEIIFPDGLLSVDWFGLGNCPNVTKLTLPYTLSLFTDVQFFPTCGVEEINVEKGNAKFVSVNGNLYSADGETLVMYAIGKTDEAFVVPKHVKRIAESAFWNAENLEEIYIHRGVERIDQNAFAYCKNAKIFAEIEQRPDG